VKKIKKAAKIEQVFGKPSNEGDVFDEQKNSEDEFVAEENYDVLAQYDDASEEQQTTDLTEKQLQKQSEIENVKSKISKILKSSNIEIIDENFGDEYELEDGDDKKQSQQDYDTLKALFGDKDRNKKDELTLTIDDFDYTYVGKYLEEFDLMHLKNIKHIRLKNPNTKKIKKALIAASLIVVLGLGGFFGYLFTRQKPIEMTTVSLSQTSATSKYYVGETFNFDGLYVNVAYSDGSQKRVKLSTEYLDHTERGGADVIGNEIKFLGGNVVMVFNYNGHRLDYMVEVKNREVSGISAKFADNISKLKKGDYIKGHINGKNDLVVLIDYGDYGLTKAQSYQNISLKVYDIYGVEYVCQYVNGSGWKLPIDAEDARIVLSYTNASLEQNFTYAIK